ncbi:phosphatidylglycerophosphate synthase, putative [Theileria equi strain WA]|uniref:CDP-diacylglycerol--glycerol-3-phosphate 3-phosphatidyltransferase n=1 Tax=Theileria equi strain WA TaxID=1537102 RepID=L1LG28_THEEQ|nr:phosphatidylglycerophosphate synthase, putative [Theileria equi strain WA]EKX74296.1 phosphatidylglycerophosphate synthase, putative [Theileria equi strain WA]|eukprot:XP_004833748.1 phosphatidylglycerophosphate synthase, putative [Theileria equi strain WA]
MTSHPLLEFITESSNIKFINSPIEYFNTLCDMFSAAKRRIVSSCLYIGTSELEEKYVDCIVNCKRDNPDLVVDMVLEKSRCTRIEPDDKSTIHLLQPLCKYDKVNISFFHSPMLDSTINKLCKPPYSEAFGTLHLKIYIADDVSIISGANCSTAYFTNRIDRYMIIDDPIFANVLHTIVATVQTMSYKLHSDLSLTWNSDLVNPLDDAFLFKKQIYKRMIAMINMCNETIESKLKSKLSLEGENVGTIDDLLTTSSSQKTEPVHKRSKYTKSNASDNPRSENSKSTSGNLPNLKDLNFEEESCEMCGRGYPGKEDSVKKYGIKRKYSPMPGYTRFMLIFQLGFVTPPIRQDELMARDLMLNFRKLGHSVLIATSYLNFTNEYLEMSNKLHNCKSENGKGAFNVMTSSPTSNEFYYSSDLRRFIPYVYCHFQQRLISSAEKSNKGGSETADEDSFYIEYTKPGYTFHTKGIWILPEELPQDVKGVSLELFKKSFKGPCAMIIGSSNFSYRSHYKDFEMSVVVETNSKPVLDGMKEEIYNLLKYTKHVSHSTISQRLTYKERLLAKVFQQYL